MSTSDFYTEYEIYKTDNITGLKNYVAIMALDNTSDIKLDPIKYQLIGSQDNIDTETALKMADEVIYISDYYPEED